MFDRSCVSRLGMRGISCKPFSVQRANHAGVFEAAAFFFDAHEESLGPALDAPLHGVLIHQGPHDADSGFHLHFVLGLACEALSLYVWTVTARNRRKTEGNQTITVTWVAQRLIKTRP